jgi:hypothetical protein
MLCLEQILGSAGWSCCAFWALLDGGVMWSCVASGSHYIGQEEGSSPHQWIPNRKNIFQFRSIQTRHSFSSPRGSPNSSRMPPGAACLFDAQQIPIQRWARSHRCVPAVPSSSSGGSAEKRHPLDRQHAPTRETHSHTAISTSHKGDFSQPVFDELRGYFWWISPAHPFRCLLDRPAGRARRRADQLYSKVAPRSLAPCSPLFAPCSSSLCGLPLASLILPSYVLVRGTLPPSS